MRDGAQRGRTVSVGTYLILPIGTSKRLRAELTEERDLGELRHLGVDFVVLHHDLRYSELAEHAAECGPTWAKDLLPGLRRALDARGLAAVPEVGQSFDGATYAALVADESVVWLPKSRPKSESTRGLPRGIGGHSVLLVPLSPKRLVMVQQDPEMLEALVEADFPGLQFRVGSAWVELQRLLYDCIALDARHQTASTAKLSEEQRIQAEALTPLTGLTLFESAAVPACRLVSVERVARISRFLQRISSERLDESLRRRGSSLQGSLLPEGAETNEERSRRRGTPPDPNRLRKLKPYPLEFQLVLRAAFEELRVFYNRCDTSSFAVAALRFKPRLRP
jgi:hypothetical protein